MSEKRSEEADFIEDNNNNNNNNFNDNNKEPYINVSAVATHLKCIVKRGVTHGDLCSSVGRRGRGEVVPQLSLPSPRIQR